MSVLIFGEMINFVQLEVFSFHLMTRVSTEAIVAISGKANSKTARQKRLILPVQNKQK